eukprot:4477546-Pleurochrysis_carterae.AAC.1
MDSRACRSHRGAFSARCELLIVKSAKMNTAAYIPRNPYWLSCITPLICPHPSRNEVEVLRDQALELVQLPV